MATFARRENRAPLESSTIVGGTRVSLEGERTLDRSRLVHANVSVSSEISPVTPRTRGVAVLGERGRGGEVSGGNSIGEFEGEGASERRVGGGALVVETRADAALRLNPGAALPFAGGISSTNNCSDIKVSRDGTSFGVSAEGMYRLVLDLDLLEGPTSVLKVQCASLPAECEGISRFKLRRLGEQHLSTILPLRPGAQFSLGNEGGAPLTLAPEARMQIYRVG